jgi:hypothetical protein
MAAEARGTATEARSTAAAEAWRVTIANFDFLIPIS